MKTYDYLLRDISAVGSKENVEFFREIAIKATESLKKDHPKIINHFFDLQLAFNDAIKVNSHRKSRLQEQVNAKICGNFCLEAIF